MTPGAAQHSVLVKIVSISSPSSFYVTFPHGMTNILSLKEDCRRESSVLPEYRDLLASLQEEASKTGRGSRLESGSLAPGTLVVARAGDGAWHRAMVRGDTNLSNRLEIFLVDLGVTETVGVEDVHLLGQQHVLLPFQAEEAELGQVEAPDRAGWEGTEAARKLEEITEEADYLSALVQTGLPHGKIVLQLSAVRGEEAEDVGETLCQAGVARRSINTGQMSDK